MSTNSKAKIDRFGIVIIESLREGELQTGTKLYNDVLKPRCTADESMFCEYYRVHSLPDFEYAISQIIQKHQSNEMLALHIEAHGCEEGEVVSSGGLITWKHFLDCCMMRTILDKYKEIPCKDGLVFPYYTNQAMNRDIKELCRIA